VSGNGPLAAYPNPRNLMNRCWLLLLLTLLAISAFATPAHAQPPKPSALPDAFASPTEVLVGLRSATPKTTLQGILARAEAAEAVARLDTRVTETLLASASGLSVLKVGLRPGNDPLDAVARLGQLPGIAWASPNWIYTYDPRELTPNDPSYAGQYHHTLMEVDDAWDSFTATAPGAGVLIGIADNGVLISHPDLVSNLWANPHDPVGGGDNDGNGYVDDVSGWDFVTNDNDPNHVDVDDHGSHVAGIAVARTNNAVGVAGVAGGNGGQSGARLLPLRFYGTDGGFTSEMIVKTFIYTVDMAEANDLKPIINNSSNIDSLVGDQAIVAALNEMYTRGGLFFNSAGNTSTQNPSRQVFEQMMLVANTNSADVRDSSSSYGDGIDMAAPGTDILSTVPSGTDPSGYAVFSGTSMASPNAAGVAALIWSRFPSYTRDQVAATLVAGADSIDAQNPGFIGQLGAGRANARRALTQAVPPPRFGALSGLPAEGGTTNDAIASFSLRLRHILDATTVVSGSFELRGAGADGSFGTADDLLVPLALNDGRPYRIGTNRLTFAIDGDLPPGDYRFIARAASLRDPFGKALDGNGDGTGGDNLVRNFRIAYPLSGWVFEDWDGDGSFDVGEPFASPSSSTVFIDQNNNGQFDQGQVDQAAAGLPLNIPDGDPAGVDTQIVMSNLQQIKDLDVAVDLTHTYVSDLRLQLTGPDGTVVTLVDGRGADGSNFSGTIFDDEAAAAITSGSAPFTGHFRPEGPLTSFDAKPAGGTWTLNLRDTIAPDSGSLISWRLIAATQEPRASHDTLGGFLFSQLSTGTHTLRLLPAAGWRTTTASSRTINRPNTATFISDQSFGVARQSAIYGYIYDDADVDGVRDPGEAGVAGLKVFLDSDGDGAADAGEPSAVSDSAGRYRLASLAPGSATLRQVLPTGRRTTGPAQGYPVTLTAGATLFGRNFGSVADTQPPTATLGAQVAPQGAATVTISFSEPVVGFDIADLVLRRGASTLSLGGAVLSGSSASYMLSVPALKVAAPGTYELRLRASGADIVDRASNTLAADATASWSRSSGDPLPPASFIPLLQAGGS
jgi:subtilisin-like proprotein convertase family protein